MTCLSSESWSVLTTLALIGRSCYVIMNLNMRESEFTNVNDWKPVLILFSIFSSGLYLLALSHKNDNFNKFRCVLSGKGLRIQSMIMMVLEINYVMCLAGAIGFDDSDFTRLSVNLVGTSLVLSICLNSVVNWLKRGVTPDKIMVVKWLVILELVVGLLSFISLLLFYPIYSMLFLVIPIPIILCKVMNSDNSYPDEWVTIRPAPLNEQQLNGGIILSDEPLS